jgi:hypothetical protein
VGVWVRVGSGVVVIVGEVVAEGVPASTV